MRNLLSILLLGVLLVSCGPSEQEVIMGKISEQENRVKELSKDDKNAEKTEAAKVKLVSILLEYFHEFPEDEHASNCLSKVHMLYSGMNNVEMAVAYADTLIDKYPDFVDRKQIIESQIVAYELSVRPRNIEMIKKYLKLWLKENKNESKEKIADTKHHLKNVDMSLQERMSMDLEELK